MPAETDRTLGVHDCGIPGPTVFITAGVHGNEPAGIEACKQVLTTLASVLSSFRGRVVAVRGNVRALDAGARFVERDLNRAWTRDQVAALLRKPSAEDGPEDKEQRELLALLRAEVSRARGPFVLLDLHSTSASGSPFTVIGDTLRNRRLAFALPVPVILGLEEAIDGSLIEFVSDLGHCALAVEGGEHRDPATPGLHAALVWLLLEAAGCVDSASVAEFSSLVELAGSAAGGVPRVVEVLWRHGLRAGEPFRVRDDLQNFTPVSKGEVLATSSGQPVRAEMSGLVLLPLRQKIGQDGYFIGRPVGPLTRMLARLARALQLQRLAALLPGVKRVPDLPHTFSADPRVARYLVRPFFNLLGYRRCRATGRLLSFTRRRPDALPALPVPEAPD